MGHRIRIVGKNIKLDAELNDTATAQAVAQALPITGEVNRWGEEVYFDIPVNKELEPGARADVEVGEIGYWPAGRAFCVFFGRTPVSVSAKPRAASAVTVIGRVSGDARKLSASRDGDKIVIESAE